jgi:hypothetical protein
MEFIWVLSRASDGTTLNWKSKKRAIRDNADEYNDKQLPSYTKKNRVFGIVSWQVVLSMPYHRRVQ